MATLVVLRFEDDYQAGELVRDMRSYPEAPILTPIQENPVMATLVTVVREFDAEMEMYKGGDDD